MERTGLLQVIGENNVFNTDRATVEALCARVEAGVPKPT